MDDCLQCLESIAAATSFDFHAYFRQRSLEFKERYQDGTFPRAVATAPPTELSVDDDLRSLFETRMEDVRTHMLSVLTSSLSARILWSMYCCPLPGFHSALAGLCPSLGAITREVRGEPNIYKLSGWLVHVLAAYSTVTEYIPKGEAPATCHWQSEAREFFAFQLKREYEALDKTSRMILHTATLGHDIGVAVSVPGHETHGVPLVSRYLAELGITDAILRKAGFDVTLVDLTWAVESIVRNHTLINRVGIEFSRERTAEKMKTLLASAEGSAWRLSFLKHFPGILVLLGVGDMMAVDDTLLTPRSIAQIHRAHEALESITRGQKEPHDYSQEGYQRFLHFLSDREKSRRRADLDTSLAQSSHAPDQFWRKFYWIQELHFALTLLRYLPDAEAALSIMVLLFDFIDSHVGQSDEDYGATRIEFSSDLKPAELKRTAAEIAKAQQAGRSTHTCDEGSWRSGEVVLTCDRKPAYHRVSVDRVAPQRHSTF